MSKTRLIISAKLIVALDVYLRLGVERESTKRTEESIIESIRYTTEPPADFGALLTIYEELGWNSLGLSAEELERMCRQSWYALYVFDDQRLVGMGRVISDGVITGIICGVCVSPSHQGKGIGQDIMLQLIQHCERHRVIPQLMCVEDLGPYYEKLGFEKFSIGMTRRPTFR